MRYFGSAHCDVNNSLAAQPTEFAAVTPVTILLGYQLHSFELQRGPGACRLGRQ
jgi:hypothetical protein